MLGFISSCYQLGSILAVPIAPWFNVTYGRRKSILAGSLIMCAGAIIQGFSQHGKPIPLQWKFLI
jgi:MFS family permease